MIYDVVWQIVRCLRSRIFHMEPGVTVAPRQHPKELWIVIDEAVICHALCWKRVHHDATKPGKIMDNLKCIQLIRDMLGRAEIGYKLIFSYGVRGRRIVIQIERDAAGTAIDIDRRILEPKPRPKDVRTRRFLIEMLQLPMHDVGGVRPRQGIRLGYTAEGGESIDRFPCFQKRVGE